MKKMVRMHALTAQWSGLVGLSWSRTASMKLMVHSSRSLRFKEEGASAAAAFKSASI